MCVCWSQYGTVRFCVRLVVPQQYRLIRHTTHSMLPFRPSTQLEIFPPMPSPLCAGLVATDHPRELGHPPSVGFSLSVGCCYSYTAGTFDHCGFYPWAVVVLVARALLVGWSFWWALPVLPVDQAFFPNVALSLLLARVVTPCLWGV